MKTNLNFLPALVLSLLACACSDSTNGNNAESATTAALEAVDPSLFAEGALVGEVTTVEGTTTTCYQIVTDGAEAGGSWFSKAKTGDGHSALIGYASDGYGVYVLKNAAGKDADSLDECRGTSDELRGYHYHAASPIENRFIGCLHGETVRPVGGHGGPPPGGGAGRPDGPPGDHDVFPKKVIGVESTISNYTFEEE